MATQFRKLSNGWNAEPNAPEPTVRRLRSSDDRSGFRSGQLDLGRFFFRFAGQNQFRHHVGTTYVAIDYYKRFGFFELSTLRGELGDRIVHLARESGVASLQTSASELARRFFERRGWKVQERKDFERHGVPIHNYRMSIDL